jgi:hypothetical protein
MSGCCVGQFNSQCKALWAHIVLFGKNDVTASRFLLLPFDYRMLLKNQQGAMATESFSGAGSTVIRRGRAATLGILMR